MPLDRDVMSIVNWYFLLAAALAFLVGLAHSVLGEILIFRRLRQGGLVPTNGGHLLRERHVRILWATWHIVTVFGWCIAAALLRLSLPSTNPGATVFIEQAFAVASLAGSALVLVGTRAKHPGWIGLLGVAILVHLGIR